MVEEDRRITTSISLFATTLFVSLSLSFFHSLVSSLFLSLMSPSLPLRVSYSVKNGIAPFSTSVSWFANRVSMMSSARSPCARRLGGSRCREVKRSV